MLDLSHFNRIFARLLPLALLASCSSAPSPEDWLAVGHDTPAQTLRTFQTGLRGDSPDLEVICFSSHFRREQRINSLAYLEMRDEVFGRFPYLRRFVDLEVVNETVHDAKTATMVVRLSAFLSERWVEIRFVRDDYFSVRSLESVLADDFASFAGMIKSQNGRLVLTLDTEDIIDPREVTKVIVGQEWKIDGFRALEGDEIPGP
jgi:hypothetical protein